MIELNYDSQMLILKLQIFTLMIQSLLSRNYMNYVDPNEL